ncbi:MAG TPA: PA domain-containing protein [Candidatus Krumholzibacteria bacterium]|nr:PA domain-containing protein [Candidatus Krumholzibacteria bacterium]
MRRILVLSMLLLLAVASLSNATTIIINNQDGVNEGLNDNTPAAPVGGNPGTTLGQLRLNVFQKAADIWAGLLTSNITIVVNAKMDPQTCTATSAVLGSTSNNGLYRDFVGAPLANTWYVMCEANKLANVDLDGGSTNDMNITFNSNLNGQASCLGGVGWYYGFDGNEGTNTEMLPVILHEMGHGLGFTSSLGATGVEPGSPPFPTVFERLMHDNTTNKQWDVMTNAERAASAINPNNVVFTGPCTTGHAPFVLTGVAKMWVNAGGPLAPSYLLGLANFGPPTFSVTGNCVLADDGVAPNSDACSALVNGGAINGNIAVIDRGTCTFVSKALLAQGSGAIAVIILNNAAGPAPALGGFDASIVIPVVSLSQADGVSLKAAMVGGPVNVTLGFDNTGNKSGADALNHVQIFTPNPFQSGSSLSHWDTSAYQNLLMEPAINNSLHNTVDLTFWAFGDMGWHDACSNPVPVAISGFNAIPTNGGVKVQASFYSSLADAKFVNVYRANGRGDDFRTLTTVNAPENGKFSFVDNSVVAGGAYRYKIGVIEGDNEYLSPVADVRLPGAKITLDQNVPNPFNPETTIRFSLPSSERVTLNVYSASGALVRTLVDGVQATGSHSFTWNGVDNRGNAVSSGVYFYRLTAGKFNDTRKMVLLK